MRIRHQRFGNRISHSSGPASDNAVVRYCCLVVLVVCSAARNQAQDVVVEGEHSGKKIRANVTGSAVDPFAGTYSDPAVPLLRLPAQFRSRRSTANIATTSDQTVEVLNINGPGCVRHLWFVFAEKQLDDLEIEIQVDDALEPQVRMPFRSFFGVMLGFEEYHIASAGIVNFPNFTVTNDPFIPPKASPGWNCYLPIPFANGCKIRLRGKSPKNGAAMFDWQQYDADTELTSLRFHSQRNIALPASAAKPFPIVETQGAGFLAGYVMGWRQKDHADMVFHNSGTRMLIDGETDPHVICGANVEDDFGFSWGFNQYQTQWAGCPYRENRGRNDQDGVFYRFFGPDPIVFRSSLLFTSNARPDDYEAVSYFYQVPQTKASGVETPMDWVSIGLIADGATFDTFQQYSEDVIRLLSQPALPASIKIGTTDYPLNKLQSEHGWVRLEHTVQHRTAYPPTDHSYYIRTDLQSESDRLAKLRLALDDWAIVWLNGEKLATLDHSRGFDTALIPVQLKGGDNQLVIKTNNKQNTDRLIWVINCCLVED